MEAECFGGEENSQHSQQQYSTIGNGPSASSSSTAWKRERTRNAFMLVYDRVLLQQQGKPAATGKGVSSPARRPSSPPPSSPVAPSASSPPPPPPSPPLSAAAAAAAAAAVDGGDDEDGEASSRVEGGEPVRARPDNNQNAKAFGQPGVSEGRGQRRRKRFRAKVPAVFMRQIHQENLEFWRFVALSCHCPFRSKHRVCGLLEFLCSAPRPARPDVWWVHMHTITQRRKTSYCTIFMCDDRPIRLKFRKVGYYHEHTHPSKK